jgi:MFS superfamily sulfate permease-like transporter
MVRKLTGWTPKSLVAPRDYSGKKFGADLAAGITVGLVALPLSMAFAIASGNAHIVSPTTTLLAGASLLLIVLTRRWPPRVPGYIVALVAATVTIYFLHLPVETVGLRFGGIPSGFPHFHVPVFEHSTVRMLISPAITVALLGAALERAHAIHDQATSGVLT